MLEGDKMDLREWVIRYERYRDSISGSINDVERKENSLLFETDDGIITVACREELSDIDSFDFDRVACLNTHDNLDWLLDSWDDVVDEDLFFLFVNPAENESWIVKPRVHNKVTEEDNLEDSLEGLFETVPAVQ